MNAIEQQMPWGIDMKLVKRLVCISLIGACSFTAMADKRHYESEPQVIDHPYVEIFYVEGRVISATPIYETQWFYRSRGEGRHRYEDVCRIREVEVRRPSRQGGGTAGAIIGGVIGGHAGAHSGGNTESAIVGAIAGGILGGVIGNEIDSGSHSEVYYRVEKDCDISYQQERRELIGYDVRYRYNGREFSMQTYEHPGRYVQLRVEMAPAMR